MNRAAPGPDEPTDFLQGSSEAMRWVKTLIERVAGVETPVLIIGEDGIGKRRVAQAVHARSARREHPLLRVNCATGPVDLVEDELFGHEREVTTHGWKIKPGKFELADEGTLLLDEVGGLPLPLQPKVLRVLEERTIERMGGRQAIKVNVRVIATTNLELALVVREKRFRQDLYFRLNVFPIRIPPLRERPGDIAVFVQHFVGKFAREMGKQVAGTTPEALRALQGYRWPGNVRELENVIERAVILITGDQLQVGDLELDRQRTESVNTEPFDLTGSLHEVSLRASQRAEKELIKNVLRGCGGNKTRAAQALQVSYKTLLTKIKNYGLQDIGEETLPLP